MSTEIDIASPQPLRHLKSTAAIALMVAAGIVSGGIFSRVHAHQELATWTDAQAIPTVATVQPQASPASQPLVLPGRLAAYINAPIYARVSGYLHAWYADIGTHVKAGQLLGVIDTPDLDQQLEQARADLQNSVANEKLAATTAKRWTEMLKQDSVSQQETDEKTSDLIAKQATVEANEANVRRLEALESFKRIVAPFAGVVTQRNVDVGDLIDAGSGTSRALFALAQSDPLRAYVQLPQAYAQNIKVGEDVVVTQAELPGQQFNGRITNISGAIDVPTRSLQIEVTLHNPDGKLRPGAYVQVALPSGTRAQLSVPGNALLFRAEGPRLAVVDSDGVVHLRKVAIAQDLGQTLEIESGIEQNDRVIINPSDSIEDGDHVEVTHPQSQSQPKGKASS